jgi:hypothetical protein
MDYSWVWSRVESYSRFLPAEETVRQIEGLAAAVPDKAQVVSVGRSRGGAPLLALRIGRGSHHAFWFGCPHPNEPIGALTVLAMARLLLVEPALQDLDFTWTLLPCADPDGIRLNEDWFGRPGDLLAYAKAFYRPEMSQQVEWTFPCRCEDLVFDAPIPETRAVMALIESLKPAFIYSLHNAGFGGVYYYLSGPAPELYDTLTTIGRQSGIVMHRGEPEVAYAVQMAPSIYQMPTIRQSYAFFRAQGVNPLTVIGAGMSSAEFASSAAGSFSLVTEVPYYKDRRLDDQTPTGVPRRESVRQGLGLMREFLAIVEGALATAAEGVRPTPFLSAIRDLARRLPWQLAALGHWAETDPSLDRPATVAEAFHSRAVLRFHHALNLGMLARALAHPVDGGDAGVVRETRDEVASLRDAWCRKVLDESPCEPIPIRTLVATQLASGLAAARYVQRGGGAAFSC